MGWQRNVPFMEYGHGWRLHKRVCQQNLRQEAEYQYNPVLIAKMRLFLRGLLNTPDDFEQHNKLFSPTYYSHCYIVFRLTLLSASDSQWVFHLQLCMDMMFRGRMTRALPRRTRLSKSLAVFPCLAGHFSMYFRFSATYLHGVLELELNAK